MITRTGVVSIFLGASLGLGCRSIVVPFVARDTNRIEDSLNPPETGEEYCSRLAKIADARGQAMLGAGIVMGIIATGAAIVGGAMGPDTSTDATWVEKNRNSLVVASGGLLAIPTTLLLMRSKNASSASSAARLARRSDERNSMDACLKASTEWSDSRGAAADTALKRFSKEIESRMLLIEQAEATKTKNEAIVITTTDPAVKEEAQQKVNEAEALIQTLSGEVVKLMSPGRSFVPPKPPEKPATPPSADPPAQPGKPAGPPAQPGKPAGSP